MRCICYTLRQSRCKNKAWQGSKYCYLHQHCERKLPACVNKFLKDNSLRFISFLSSGVYGQVYDITDGKKNYAMKVAQINKDTTTEIKFIRKASALGVAPKIYECGQCQNDIYLIMEKLDITLDQRYPYRSKDVVDALKLYKKLLDHNILQNDLKGPNVMLKGNTVYIIDYGRARSIYKNKDRYLKKAAVKLLNSLFCEAPNYGSATYWLDDSNPNKYKQLIRCTNAVRKYLNDTSITPTGYDKA